MPATAGYQAGLETNATQISYGVETTWGTAPAVQFQAIRYTSETLAYAKTRQRPAEITGTREAAQGVTTQQQASGTINYAFPTRAAGIRFMLAYTTAQSGLRPPPWPCLLAFVVVQV